MAETSVAEGEVGRGSAEATRREPASQDESPSTEAVKSAPTPIPEPSTTAAAQVIDKLATMDVARREERERRREEARALSDPRESTAQFLASFAARQRGVEEALQRMLAQAGVDQPPAGSGVVPPAATDGAALLDVSAETPERVASSLELLSAEALAMEQAAATSSYFLPAYDQKQCAAAVAALRAAIEDARAALAPRR
jgi:hypothetical protein